MPYKEKPKKEVLTTQVTLEGNALKIVREEQKTYAKKSSVIGNKAPFGKNRIINMLLCELYKSRLTASARKE